MIHKTNCFGNNLKASFVWNQVTGNKKSTKPSKQSDSNLLDELCNEQLSLKPAKLKDLLHLKRFLTNPNLQAFYDSLVLALGLDERNGDDIEYVDVPLTGKNDQGPYISCSDILLFIFHTFNVIFLCLNT